MATDLSWLDPNLAALYLSQRRQQEEEVPPLRNLQFNQGPAQTPSFDLSQSITPLVAAGFSDVVGALGGLGETIGRGLGLPEAFTGTAEQVRINAEEYAKKRIAESPGLKEELEKSIMDSDRPVAHAAAVAMRSIPQMAPVAASIVAGAPAAVVAGALGLETIISAGMGAGDIANQIDTAPRDVLVRDSKPYLKAYNATDPRLPEDQRDRLAREEIKRAAMAMGAATTGAGTAAGTAIAGRGVFSLLERPGRGLVQGGLYGARREAAQEFLQSFGESIGSDITRGQFVDPAATSIDKMLARGFESAIEGAAAGAIAGGAVGVPAGFIQRNMPKTVEELADEKVAEIRKAGKEQRAKSEKETPDIVRGGLRDILATPGLFKGEMPADIAMKIAEAQAAARAQTDEAATQWAQGVETPPEVAPVSQEEYEDLLQQAAQPEPPVAGLSAEDWAGMPIQDRLEVLAQQREEQLAQQREQAIAGHAERRRAKAERDAVAERAAQGWVENRAKGFDFSEGVPAPVSEAAQALAEKAAQAWDEGRTAIDFEAVAKHQNKAAEEAAKAWAKAKTARDFEAVKQRIEAEWQQKLGQLRKEREAVQTERTVRAQRELNDALAEITARYGAHIEQEAIAKEQAQWGLPPSGTEGIEVTELPAGEEVNVPYRPGKRAQGAEARLPVDGALRMLAGLNGGKRLTPQVRTAVTQALSGKPLFRDQLAALTDYFRTLKPNTLTEALIGTFINEIGGNVESKNLDTGAERKSPAVQPATANAATGKQADKGQAEGTTRSAEAKPEEVKETKDAAQEGKKPEGSKPEREGTDAQRKAAETGGGNRAGQGTQGTSAAEEGKKLDWHEWIKRERPGEKIGTDHPDYQKLRDKFDKYRGGAPTKKGEAPTLAPAEKGERTEAQVKAVRQAPEKPAEKSAAPAEKPAKKSAAPAEQAPVPSAAEQLVAAAPAPEVRTEKAARTVNMERATVDVRRFFGGIEVTELHTGERAEIGIGEDAPSVWIAENADDYDAFNYPVPLNPDTGKVAKVSGNPLVHFWWKTYFEAQENAQATTGVNRKDTQKKFERIRKQAAYALEVARNKLVAAFLTAKQTTTEAGADALIREYEDVWKDNIARREELNARLGKNIAEAKRRLNTENRRGIYGELVKAYEKFAGRTASKQEVKVLKQHLDYYLDAGRFDVVDPKTGKDTRVDTVKMKNKDIVEAIVGKKLARVVFARKEGLQLLPDMRGLSTMRANDVQPIIDELHKKWGALKNGNVRVVPVDTYNDLEAGDRLLFTGADAQFDGVAAYNPFTKRVVIIADRIADSNEALKVILHEVKGHYGLRTILGERYYPIMKELYTKNKLIHDLANEHIEFTKDIATATEEALADAAMNENLPKMKGWEKLIAAVRDWLRKFNFGRNLLREFTDNDIRYLLTRASSLVERGELGVPFNVNAQPGTVFSRGADAFTLEGFDKADTVGKANEFVRKVIRNITSTGQELTNTKHNPAERLIHLHPRVMKEALRWSTLHNINQLWGDIFKGDLVHRKDLLESRRTTITNSLNAEFDKMDARFLKWWTDATPLQRHQFMALMGESTRKNLDPRIPFDKHKWLPTTDAAVMAELRGYHEVLWSVYQGLKPSGGAQLFDDLAEFNKKRFLQQHMQVLWNFGKGEGLPESVIGDNPAIKRNWVERSKDLPQAMEAVAAKYAKDLNTENKKQNDMFTDEEIKEANKMLADKEQLRRYRSPKGDLGREKGEDGLSPFDKDRFIKQLRHIRQTYERDNQAPYFHLARHGEYFVSFKMNAEKEDLAKVVATRFREAGIVHFMPTDFVEDEAMMKFDSLTDWKNADAVIEKLKADGYIKKYVGGKTSENVTEFSEAQPRYIEEMIRRIETDIELSKEEKEEISSAVRRIHIDMLPETSIHKSLMKREGIAGYDMDMWRAYAERQRSSNYYIGSIATMHEIDDILRDMSTQVQRMQGKSDVKDEEVPAEDIDRRKSVFASLLFSEITRRHHEQLSPVDTPVFDQMRAAGFNYFLAMLPAYLITNLAQPFQLTLPELGSRYGFVKSGQAIARATGKAFKLTKEVVKKGREEFGWRGVLDALVEDRMLTFLAEDERKVIRDAIDSGKLNFGQATEIGRIASGQQRWRSTAMKIGSVFGYYSEFVNRVTTVLAHYELAKAAGELTADDVKNDTANYKTEPSKPHKKGEARLGWLDRSMVLLAETQFDYRQENIARALGKRGVLGAVTPLVASFHQYQFQYLEKIVREVLNLFDKNERPKAAKFLAGTMGTTMFLAGSLGLPFVSLLSAIVDAIVGDDDEPYDMKTAYRNWLAGVFGKDVAEVLARGMPRAIGVDTSYRMGLQDLMPFSRFLADKRKLEDAWKDHTVEMAGAFFGAALNIGVGASEMLQGDILKGAEKMVPSALKGPLRTAEVGMHGFTNKAGNRLPIEATPWDLLVLSSGFAPSKKAEQSEATFAYKSYERQISQRATLLRNRLATAIERRDMDRYAEVAKEALEFERKTGIPVLSKLEDTVTRRARERAASSISGVESALSKLPKTLPMAQFANL